MCQLPTSSDQLITEELNRQFRRLKPPSLPCFVPTSDRMTSHDKWKSEALNWPGFRDQCELASSTCGYGKEAEAIVLVRETPSDADPMA